MSGGPSFAKFPRCQVAYTEAVPIQSVAPTAEPENKKKTEYSFKIPKGPNKTTKNKPCISKKSKKKTTLKPNVKRKDFDVVYEESKYDFSKLPPPVCSCTGVARQCYKCGINGWQSSCCTSKISVFPLPTRSLRPGVRVGGRKMTLGAYRKLLCKLASQGYDLSHPVDLKAHWAKHGTNNFVTFK
uniref:protein BASIC PENTACYSTEINE7-like n=1 Tax=Erigeron canadensis TaxID=72917 RepID=UPI001CB90CD2|nr:protein BASIC PENTACYSTEINE7-like [Erigeron canadensis]